MSDYAHFQLNGTGDQELTTIAVGELAILRAKNVRLRAELERIPNVVSYVTATLSSAVDDCRRHGSEWGKVHGGRAGSSIRQLNAMAERAREILEDK